MKEYLTLFYTFFRIGAMTFGGGYAMLPILKKEIVDKHSWCTEKELLDYFALGQCTPGIIAINTSTFIGHQQKGVLGAFIATSGMICPSFIIITILAAFFQNFSHIFLIQYAFTGIRIAVGALILHTVIKLALKNLKSQSDYAIFGLCFLLGVLINISPALIVMGAAGAGLLIHKADH